MIPGRLRVPDLALFFLLGMSACSPISISGTPPTVLATPTHPSINGDLAVPGGSPSAQVKPASPQPRITLTESTQPTTPQVTLTPNATASAFQMIEEIQYQPWEQVLALAWSPDGQNLAAAAGETIYIRSLAGLIESDTLQAGVWSSGLAFSPDGKFLASAGRDGRLQIWESSTGQQLSSIQAHKKGVNCVAFSPDGRLLASGGNDGMVRLWDPITGESVGQIIGGTFSIPSLAFSLDGARVGIANGDIIRFRDTTTLRFTQTLNGDHHFFSLDISPNGAELAAGDSAGKVQIWDLSNGEKLGTFETEFKESRRSGGLIWQVAYSPDGLTLAAAAGDGSVWLWDTPSRKLLVRLEAHSLATTSVAFSPDGRWLATGGLDGALRLWQAP